MTTEATWFQKKPVRVQAMEWDGTAEGASPIIDWILANDGTARYHDETSAIAIDTLEGTMNAKAGDFIIRGVRGEFYPCDGEIFRETYDPC